jgi:Homeodomain-like domain
VHTFRTVRAALELAAGGATATEIARELSVPRRTVVDWLRGALPRSVRGTAECATHADRLGPEYVYLLGLYLGDGCLSRHHRGVYRLRIVLDTKYPGIVDSAASAIGAVRPGRVLAQLRPQNCVEVSAYWKCWPCLFPQHGAGREHQRRIELTDWQTTLVDRWPEQLLRGLIHSDGCRFQNTGTNWSWPRYSFSQVSDDIRTMFCDACDRLGLRWTRARTTIYVSRKADVAILDEFIGPKR